MKSFVVTETRTIHRNLCFLELRGKKYHKRTINGENMRNCFNVRVDDRIDTTKNTFRYKTIIRAAFTFKIIRIYLNNVTLKLQLDD